VNIFSWQIRSRGENKKQNRNIFLKSTMVFSQIF